MQYAATNTQVEAKYFLVDKYLQIYRLFASITEFHAELWNSECW